MKHVDLNLCKVVSALGPARRAGYGRHKYLGVSVNRIDLINLIDVPHVHNRRGSAASLLNVI